MAVKPDTSVKSTVTCLRSPSMALRVLRIFSARCFGVYVWGDAKRAAADSAGAEAAGAAAGTSGAPHSPQNLSFGAFAARQAGQIAASRAPHSPQNFVSGGLSWAHAGHFIARCAESSLLARGGQGGGRGCRDPVGTVGRGFA